MTWLSIIMRPFIWLNNREPGLFETASGLAAIFWGLLALQSFPAQDRPDSLGVYAAYGIEGEIALATIAIGFGQLLLFDIIDRKWEEHWLRWWGALLLLTHWLILSGSALFMRDSPVGPGVGCMMALAIGNFSLCLRIIERGGFRSGER